MSARIVLLDEDGRVLLFRGSDPAGDGSRREIRPPTAAALPATRLWRMPRETRSDDGRLMDLTQLRGRWVVLYFYPRAGTPGCSVEAQRFEAALPEFGRLGAEVIGVSTDTEASQARFRDRCSLSFPLLPDGLALGMASMVVYFLAREGIVTLNGQSQGILMVLVLGAGTDYALLLTARYREELHEYKDRFDAMIVAWRESAPAIVASAATVAIGLLQFAILTDDFSVRYVANHSMTVSPLWVKWVTLWAALRLAGIAAIGVIAIVNDSDDSDSN